MADWKDILSENEEKLSDEDLLRYLNEELSEEEKGSLEKMLADSSFETDAIEGLKQIENPESIRKHVKILNQKLHQQLLIKKQRKEKSGLKDFQWSLLAIIILLFLCIVGYVLVRMNNS